MTTKIILWLLVTVLLTTFSVAEAQQAVKIYRIGYLLSGSPIGSARLLEAFRQGMRDFGYIEGKDFIIEARWGEGDDRRLPALAANLVRLNVDIIVAAPTAPALAAHGATKSIPIVVAHMSDPVEAGLVANLAQPGGNVTGLRSLTAELGGKRLELLKEAFPRVSRVVVLSSLLNPGGKQQLRAMQDAALALGLELRVLDWKRPNPDFHGLSRAIAELRPGALTTTSSTWQLDHLPQMLDLSAKTRLPAIYPNGAYADAGGLMSYGINPEYFHRRAAYYVDKILKGAKPADLPIEQATKIELVINLKTAKQIGVTIPPAVLMDADRVIK